MRHPSSQLAAGHRPADLIPPGTHPGEVVIVQTTGPNYAGRILLTIAIAGGTALVIVVLAYAFQTMTAAAAAAVPAVGGAGVTVKLTRKGR
ncbi:hypothetical protein [Streptomyces sp. NPDC020983]|uniref:hypothetical protein n=1 Tax=Streptomyces sp. NPDC020983 TaxID=3365106 RepID=UPI00378E54E7